MFKKHLHRIWKVIISNIFPILGGVSFIVVAIFVDVFDFAKSFVEKDTFVIESVDRQSSASNTYTALVRSQRSVQGATTVFLPASSYCNQNTQASVESLNRIRSALLTNATRSNGLNAAIRFNRSDNTRSVTFRISSGKLLFVGTVGDLPRNICFNEAENAFTIEYADSNLDVIPEERILFVQTNEPGGQISAIGLNKRSDAYLLAAFFVILVFILLLTILFWLVVSNTHRVKKNGEKDKEARQELAEQNQSTADELSILKEDMQRVIRTTHGFEDLLRRWMAGSENNDGDSSDASPEHILTRSNVDLDKIDNEQIEVMLKRAPDSAAPSSGIGESMIAKIYKMRGK